MLFSAKSAEIGFGTGAQGVPPSEKTRGKKLKSLHEKGFIKILNRSNKGTLVSVLLPTEIAGLIREVSPLDTKLEDVDFYSDRRLLLAILERENYRCFYTGKKLAAEDCYLDHVVAQSSGGDNSYKNIVATSYDANSMKNNKPVDEFIRQIYREGLVSVAELNELNKKIVELQSGKIKPNLERVLMLLSKS
jgi:hypothetical protein